MIKTTHTVLGLALAAIFLLAGCGPEPIKATSETSSTTSTSSEASKSDQQVSGGNSEQFERIQACLKKAGLEDRLPQRREKGGSSERPSAPPSGEPPSGGPQGAEGQGPVDQAGGPFADEDVRAALTACGIDVPERPNGPDARSRSAAD